MSILSSATLPATPRAADGGDKDEAERLLWHCGAHTAEPNMGAMWADSALPNVCCFLWHVGCKGGSGPRISRPPFPSCRRWQAALKKCSCRRDRVARESPVASRAPGWHRAGTAGTGPCARTRAAAERRAAPWCACAGSHVRRRRPPWWWCAVWAHPSAEDPFRTRKENTEQGVCQPSRLTFALNAGSNICAGSDGFEKAPFFCVW